MSEGRARTKTLQPQRMPVCRQHTVERCFNFQVITSHATEIEYGINGALLIILLLLLLLPPPYGLSVLVCKISPEGM